MPASPTAPTCTEGTEESRARRWMAYGNAWLWSKAGFQSKWCPFWLQPTSKLEEKSLTTAVMALLAVTAEISLCVRDSQPLCIVKSGLLATQASEIQR